jgi:hypothetical protein
MAAMLSGCAGSKRVESPKSVENAPITEAEAIYTPAPVKIDGRLDDPIWNQCPVYELQLAENPATGDVPEDSGRVRFAWDDTYFYMGCNFIDRDVAGGKEEDGPHHYRAGDVAELFLKPESGYAVWEMYVTPGGFQTTFFFPGRGRMGMLEHFESSKILDVAATVNGTLNDWQDTDVGWAGEMAVPISELKKHGGDFAPGVPWRILVGRYNYSRYLMLASGPEYSTFPRLPVVNYHDVPNYAKLKLVK